MSWAVAAGMISRAITRIAPTASKATTTASARRLVRSRFTRPMGNPSVPANWLSKEVMRISL